MSLLPASVDGLDHGNQAWVLTSAALVQLMTPGLAFFYGGLVNEGSVVNTMMLSYGCMALVTLLWGLVGYSLAFDESTNTGVIGLVDLAASKFDERLRVNTAITEHAFMMFQLMFAIITSAIISGAVVGKMRWSWFMAFTAMWHIFVYCPLAHWFFYYKGWMYTYGVLEFAGGMVVHIASGVSAFVLTWWLGRSNSKPRPHNVPFVLLGAALLWFGWFGFNAGSALAADGVAARAFVNTQYSAALAMLTWNALEITFNGSKWFNGVPTAVGTACGAVTGLVGITPGAAYVTNMWAFGIGFLTVIPVFFTPKLVHMAGVDDRLDVFAFHGVGGIMGTLLTGLFATVQMYSSTNGAFYYNAPQYGKQIVGILVTVFLSVVATTVIYWTLWAIAYVFGSSLTIPKEEQANSDVSQHGENAYSKDVALVAAVAPKEPEAAAPTAA